MIGSAKNSDAARRLTDLRRDQPGDATLQNLLGVLNAKLELCARLPVYAWEASNEGHAERAASFRALASAERRACSQVMDELRAHLQERATDEGADA